MFTKKKECCQLWFGAAAETNKAGTTRMQNHPSNNSAQNFQVPVPVFENLRLIPSPPTPLPLRPSHMFFELVAIVGVSFYLGQQHTALVYGDVLQLPAAGVAVRQKLITRHLCQQPATLFASRNTLSKNVTSIPPHSPHLRLTSHTHSHTYIPLFVGTKRNELQCGHKNCNRSRISLIYATLAPSVCA